MTMSTASGHRAKQLGGPTLTIAGVDMMDGTPLLDLKPYMPLFDIAMRPSI